MIFRMEYSTFLKNRRKFYFKGFVENTSGESLTIEYGSIFTKYKVFDQEGNEVKDVQKTSADYGSELKVATIESTERLVENLHTILDLPEGEYTVLVQFTFEVSGKSEIVPADLEVEVRVE